MWRNLGILMVLCFFSIFLISGHARSQKPVVMVDFLKDCVAVRLVGMTVSETRGRYLIGIFETMDKDAREVQLRFPAHSLSPHEWTLANLIRSVCRVPGEKKDDQYFKIDPDMEVEFMVPYQAPMPILVDGKPPRVILNKELLEKSALKAVRFKKEK